LFAIVLLFTRQVTSSGNQTLNISNELSCDNDYSPNYNFSLHVGMIFVLLAASGAGTILSVALSAKFTKPIIQYIKMMAIGVILSFAWIHLFTFGDVQLRSSCLPTVFSGKYNSWASLFAIIALSTTQFIQFLAEMMIRKVVARSTAKKVVGIVVNEGKENPGKAENAVNEEKPAEIAVKEKPSTVAIDVKDPAPSISNIPSTDLEAKEQDFEKLGELRVTAYMNIVATTIHSFVIGITFGFSRNPELQVFIAPMILYNFFEGFALITTIQEAQFENRRLQWIVAFAYTLFSMVGTILGLLANSGSSFNSQYALMAQGVMNSLSAGLLTYDVFIYLICPSLSYHALKGHTFPIKITQYMSVWAGFILICVVGGWKN
jgi:solute carrier family 39 (zinc transporter), member 1/2/3